MRITLQHAGLFNHLLVLLFALAFAYLRPQEGLGVFGTQAPRARGLFPVGPAGRLGAQHELERAAVSKNVVPAQPALVPLLAVDLERLDLVRVLGAALARHLQRLAAAEGNREVREPRRADEKGRLPRHGVQANHVPQQPRLHGSRVAVAGQAVARRAVVGLCDEAAALDGQVLAVDKVVQVRRREARLVARVEEGVSESAVARKDAGLKRLFETPHKRCVAVAELDEPGQVVVRVERVLPGERLVVVVAPVAAAARQRVLGQEARRVSRADEAAEAQRRHVGVPVVAPVVGAVKVSLKLDVLAQTCRDGGEGKVVDRTITKVVSNAHQATATRWQNSLFHRTADGS